MKVEAEQVLCRFHLTNRVQHATEPLYQWIVATARELGVQGGTVLKGFMGLRADGRLLHESRWRLTQEVPVIVEIVDGPRPLERLLERVEPNFNSGEITLERAHVVLYRRAGAPGKPGDITPPFGVIANKSAGTAWEVKTMKLPEEGVLMRIFISESDRDRQRNIPLYESIVQRAREAQLAGATVLKGPMGFGRHSRMHTSGLLELSTDLPIVVEIVDAEDRINQFIPVVDDLVTEGLVTLEAVRVLKYTSAESTR